MPHEAGGIGLQTPDPWLKHRTTASCLRQDAPAAALAAQDHLMVMGMLTQGSPDGGVEGGGHEHEGQMRVVRAGPCGRPLDGVDLLGVRREVVQRRALAQAPDLRGVVVRA